MEEILRPEWESVVKIAVAGGVVEFVDGGEDGEDEEFVLVVVSDSSFW